jgi:hypothetical protein
MTMFNVKTNKSVSNPSWVFASLTIVLIALSVTRPSVAERTEKRIKYISIRNSQAGSIPENTIDDSSFVAINKNVLQSSESDLNDSVESKEKILIQSKNPMQGLHIDTSVFPIKYLKTKTSAPKVTRPKVRRNQVDYTVKHYSSRISATRSKPNLKTDASNVEKKMSRRLLKSREPKATAQRYTSNYRDPAYVKTQYSELPKFLYDHQLNYPISAASGLDRVVTIQDRVPPKGEKTSLQPYSMPDEFQNRADSGFNTRHYYQDEFYPKSNNNHQLKHLKHHIRHEMKNYPYQFEDTAAFQEPKLLSEEIYNKNGPPYGKLHISNVEPSPSFNSGRNLNSNNNQKPRIAKTSTQSPPKKYVIPKTPSNSKPRPLSRPAVAPTSSSSVEYTYPHTKKYYKPTPPKLLIHYPSESKYTESVAVLPNKKHKNEKTAKQMKPDDFKYFQ